jgi:hypothetical protein
VGIGNVERPLGKRHANRRNRGSRARMDGLRFHELQPGQRVRVRGGGTGVLSKIQRKYTAESKTKQPLAAIKGCGSETPSNAASLTALGAPLSNISVRRRLRSSRRHPHERLRSAPGRRDRSLQRRRGATRDVSHPSPRPRPACAAIRRARVPAISEVRDLRPRVPPRALRRVRLRQTRALFLQRPWLLQFLRRKAHGGHGGAPRRPRAT